MQIILTDTLITRLAQHNPSTLGELLRDICFTDEGMGCYSNFELIEGFEPVKEPIGDALLLDLLGDFMFDPNEVSRVAAHRNEEMGITVLWFWDGDGTLIFHSDAFTLVNHDCKKDYDWDVVDLDAELTKHRDYIAARRAKAA